MLVAPFIWKFLKIKKIEKFANSFKILRRKKINFVNQIERNFEFLFLLKKSLKT